MSNLVGHVLFFYQGKLFIKQGIIGVRDQFRLGGPRSVARIFSPIVACPNIFSKCCLPENQVVLPEYYMFFARKLLFDKF